MEADFSGYATKAGVQCSDGRTISPEAFRHMDGKTVPLVWQHGHSDPKNILGHALLEYRNGDVYSHAFFNSTPSGQMAKQLVEHKDIDQLSIYANQLVEKSKLVIHGMIKEVSLVLAGANPKAKIDYVRVAHSDDYVETLEDEAVIFTGLTIAHGEDISKEISKDIEHAAGDSVKAVYDAMTDEQKAVVHYMLGAVLEETATASHSEAPVVEEQPEKVTPEETTDEGDALNHQEGPTLVTKNLFENNGGEATKTKAVLKHSDIKNIFEDAKKSGSFKAALAHAVETLGLDTDELAHGITNMELLFPDAKALTDRPDFDKRRTEWVASVLSGTSRTPFAKIKTLVANLNYDEARAKGYIKGTLKEEEYFPIASRSTGPTTIYKKQQMDRDDIIDITDFDVVAWLWMEIRIMLEEELARAILIGDGRSVMATDKIKDPAGASSGDGIRSILHDHDYYAQTININPDNTNYLTFVDAVIENRRYYKGTGTPTMYTTEVVLAKMLTLRDADGRRYYRTVEELASELRVAAIVPVEVMETEPDLLAILVNLKDYNLGTNRGGEITTFDDFDLDYNLYKYLMETRLSGALVKPKSALIFKKVASTDVLVPTFNAPTFVSSTGVVTIVATTHIVYKNKDTGATLSTGAQTALAAGASMTVVATPASGYYLADNINDEWTFTRDAA